MLMELCWRSSLRYEAKNAARGVGEKKIKRSVEKEREREREREEESVNGEGIDERVKEERNGGEKGRKFFSRSKGSFHVICRVLESR